MVACTALFASCNVNDDDHGRGEGSTDNLDLSNLTAEGRIGQVRLYWDNPTNPDYYYAMVTYTNAAGDAVNEKVSFYSVDKNKGEGHTEARIKGFTDTKTYEFQVTPYTSYGIAGKTATVSCAPEDQSFAYKYVAETVTVEPAVEGAVVKWVDEYEIPVWITITYKNLLGETVSKEILTDEDGEVTVGAFSVPTEITVTSSNEAKTATSDPFKVTATPADGEIERTNISVVSNNGGILGGGMEVEKMLDGNWQSTWHSSTAAGGDVVIVFDLSAAYQVGKVEFVRRTDDPGAIGYPETITVQTSLDNSTYETAGVLEFDAEYVFNHVLAFDKPMVGRYLKLIISHSGSWTHLAEMVVYSSSEAKCRYAAESAAELVPDPDDDDTYYEDTEYLYPLEGCDAGWYNHVTFEYGNGPDFLPEDYPAMITYTTTGGDSWLPLAPMQADPAGPMLVFRYKSTAALMCEFFWCPGGFPNGLAGGKETPFNIKATTEWKTCKSNMKSAWASFGWGKAGDGVRFDIGDGPDQTVVVNLMHWRALADGE